MGLTIHNLVFLRYGREFQIQRKIFQESLIRSKCTEYHPIQVQQARVLVRSLLSNPEAHEKHFIWWRPVHALSTAALIPVVGFQQPLLHKLHMDTKSYRMMIRTWKSWRSAPGWLKIPGHPGAPQSMPFRFVSAMSIKLYNLQASNSSVSPFMVPWHILCKFCTALPRHDWKPLWVPL